MWSVARVSPAGRIEPVSIRTGTELIHQTNDGSSGEAITELSLHLDPRENWQKTLLELRFDGERTVSVPLGDFFVWEPQGIETRSLPIEALHDGTVSVRFEMPFRTRASLRLVDVGGGPRNVEGHWRFVERPFDQDSLYFHANWTGVHSVDGFAPTEWRIASINGRGVYVGTVLHVANQDPQWWGEGDHRVWVDGEAFPSLFGTGTEDYFGFAFCSTERFSDAFSGQVRANRTSMAGYTTLYRFHVLDSIPFSRSLAFDLESIHWAFESRHVPVSFDAVYYFYGSPGTSVDTPIPAPSYDRPVLPPGTEQSTGDQHTRC